MNPGIAIRYAHVSQFILMSPRSASAYRSSTSPASSSQAPISPATRTSIPGCCSANAPAWAVTRSGSTPANRKYGATTIRSAPSRRARSRAAGTDGSASETKLSPTSS